MAGPGRCAPPDPAESAWPRRAGAAALTDELTALGSRVTVRAADTGDRAALARVLDDVPPDVR
ncbi:hypothetical protein NKG94_04025 [Micromonospora sp. M12]